MKIGILHLEDDPLDADLVRETLAADGLDVEIRPVESREDFIAELLRREPDLILSDYNMPSFDGMTALLLARANYPDLPFIFVSGTIGEDRAVEVLKSGATDYVLKTRLEKLPFAIRRALEVAEGRRSAAEAARRLEERERQFRRLIEEIPGFFFMGRVEDGKLHLSFVSPQVRKLLGDAPEDLLSDPGFWTTRTVEEDRDRVAETLRRCVDEGEAVEFEHRLRSREGRVVWVRVGLNPEKRGRPEVRGMVTDLTERKQLEEQFLQAQKMEAVGRLAGGVAHDFNNLLTVINGYCELMLAGSRPDDPRQADLREIHNACGRATTLTRQLLAFSRKQVFQPVQVDVNRLLRGLESMLGRLLSEDVPLTLSLARDLSPVRADPGQIEQAVVNLVVNARDAMPEGGRITLESAAVRVDEALARTVNGLKTGDYVRVSVSDAGTGIPSEVRRHLFEPFFTTKEKGKGTGLGLSTVHGIVTQSGGAVAVESVLGRGSTFRIYLPACKDGADVEPREPERRSGRGTETVLVVEEQGTLRRLISTALESAGYSVLAAADAPEALRLAESQRGPLHLLMADRVMPSMAGADLAQALRRLHPETRALFLSGDTDRDLEEAAAGTVLLQKPFTLHGLMEMVRALLDAPAGGAS